jgi:hypothetical protein
MKIQASTVSIHCMEAAMPRSFLRILPSGARPSLFSGD